MSWVEYLIIGVIVSIIGAIGVGFYFDSQKPTIGLRKDEWSCTRTEQRTHLQPMLVGKVPMMMPMNDSVCVEYHRN